MVQLLNISDAPNKTFFVNTGVWTQALALHHLSHALAHFGFIFQIVLSFHLGLALDHNPPTYAGNTIVTIIF
jgi:hypothetical protein